MVLKFRLYHCSPLTIAPLPSSVFSLVDYLWVFAWDLLLRKWRVFLPFAPVDGCQPHLQTGEVSG